MDFLTQTAHRPYPLPGSPWLIYQNWCNLLFAHWPLTPDALRPLIPPPLELDTFDGRAWLGVVPFNLVGLHANHILPLPLLNRFPEINVRTYVTYRGIGGVWFFSLDAANAAAVLGARLAFHLPYFPAHIKLHRTAGQVTYTSRRLYPAQPSAIFSAAYGPAGAVSTAAPGSLAHFVCERYCLYAVDEQGRLGRCDIQHAPWPLQPAWADLRVNTLPAADGIRLPATAPILHYSAEQPTVVWPLRWL